MSWEDDQKFERDWHGDCVSTEFGERLKQTVYARKMGLKFEHDGKSPFSIDCGGKKIIEVGGGPYGMTLFCKNVKGTIIDPCDYPVWVLERYLAIGIQFLSGCAETMLDHWSIQEGQFEEAWIANCLQHVQDPEKIIANARKAAKLIRIFEWVNTGTSPGHPWNLTPELLDQWLGGEGKVERLDDQERGLVGTCYYGIFPT